MIDSDRDSPAITATGFRRCLAAVLLLAAALRIAHVAAQYRLPLFDGLMIDSKLYDQWALSIAAGDWLGGDRAFFMDPLYPYVLAVFYRCFGHDLVVVRLFQAMLGVATCGFVASLGRRVGGTTTGITAALMLALYQPLIFEGGEIEKTALGVALLSAALALAVRDGIASRLGAGICMALATLARGNLLMMAPLGVFYFLSPTNHDNAGSRTARCGAASAYMLGFVLILAPVVGRNHHVSGQWMLTTSQAGANFYLGNNPSNATGAFSPLPFVRPSPTHEEEDFRNEAEARAGKPLTSGEVSAFWFREAVDHIRQHPGFAAMVDLRKTTLFFSNLEVPDGWSLYFLRRYSPALRIAAVTFGWLLPLAFVGAVTSFGSNRRARLLTGFVAVYAFSLVLFYVHSRYRIYAVPAVAVLAAVGLEWIIDAAKRGHWHRVVAASVAAGSVGVFSFAGAPLLLDMRPGDFVMDYAHLASLYEDNGDFPAAEALLHEGLEQRPAAASLLCGLASLHLRKDDPATALGFSRACVEANENYLDAWFLAGQANEALGNFDEAMRCYRRQLDIVPGHQFAAWCLQNLMARETAAKQDGRSGASVDAPPVDP